MRPADLPAVVAVAVVAVAVASGGAFDSSQRVVMGVGLALVAMLIPACLRTAPRAGEWLALVSVGWGALSAAVVAGYPLAAREMVGGWLVAWLLWVVARRMSGARHSLLGAVLVVASVPPAVAIAAECVAAGRLRMGGLYVNPNVAAALLVPAVAVAWHTASPTGRRIGVWVVTIAAATGVILSGSRAGLMALVVVAAVLLPSGRARWVGVAGAGTAAAVFAVWRFLQSPDALAWHRLEIWGALWSLVRDHPILGVGPGWLEDATGVVRIAHEGTIARFSHVIGSAESTPLGWLVRTGFVGLGLLGVSGVLVWRAGRPRSSAAAAVLAGIGILMLFHDVLMVDVVLWWWALLIGVVWPCGGSDGARDGPVLGVLPIRLATGFAIGFMVLWSISAPAHARAMWWRAPSSSDLAHRVLRAEPWFAEPAQWRTADVLNRETWTWTDAAEALAWSRTAVRLRPGSSAVWGEHARVQARVVAELGPWPDAVEGARLGYEMATELEPHLPWPWLQWARLERSLGRRDEARALAERAVAEEPHFVRGHLFLARLALDGDELEAADESYRRARAAFEFGRRRELTDYERDLLRAPSWQVEDVQRGLATRGDHESPDPADPVE